MARIRSGRLALAIFLVALVAVAVAVALPAVLAATGLGPRPAPAGAAVDRAHAAHAAALRERLTRLALAARLLAREGALESVLRGGEAADGAAALADLLAQRRPELGFDLAVVLDAQGRVVAASEGAPVSPGDDLSAEPPVAAALAGESAAGVWRAGAGLSHVAVVPVAPDFELLGHVLTGAAVDRVFALEVARFSGAAVTFAAAADGAGVVPVASSLGDAPAAELVAALAVPGGPLAAALGEGETREAPRVEVGGRTRRAMAVPLATPGAASPAGALVLSAEAGGAADLEALLPLAAGAGAGLLLALLLAPLVARRTLAPAARLAEAVEAAPRESFARRLEPRRYRVLAPLAAALDRLFRGLHEDRSLAAAASGARRRVPRAVAEEEPVVAERGAVALFDLRGYATLGEDPRPAAEGLAGDLARLRQAVTAAGGRLEAAVGHRALASFSGDEAAWRALSAAAAGLSAVAAAGSSFDGGEPAAAAVASGRLARGGGGEPGGRAPLLVGPAVQLAESVLREAAPGDLAMSRAVHREVAERLASRGAASSEQRGLLSPQPLYVLPPVAIAALVGDAETPAAAAAPEVGARFAGGYEVLRREGSSAGAELWKVRDPEEGREAALKWLPRPERPGAAGLDGPLERARRLDHPGLAQIGAVGEADGGVYLLREWVEGVPLSRLGQLPAPAALGLVRQLAAALAAVHREGLFHGRVKPENVIVEADGRARLVDLGVAAVAGAAPSASAGERTVAPEQRAAAGTTAGTGGDAGGAGDARSDVYALGVLLHRLALGRWPGEAAAEAAAAPKGLDRVLERATAEEPDRRHADAGELAAALEDVSA